MKRRWRRWERVLRLALRLALRRRWRKWRVRRVRRSWKRTRRLNQRRFRKRESKRRKYESDKEEAVPKESSKKETVVEKEPPSAASSKSKEKYDLEYAINGKTYSLVITQNKPNQGACITIKKVSGKTQNYVERTKDDVVQPVVFKKKKYDVYAPRNTTLKTLTTNTALVASLFLLSRIDACSLWSPDS